jgi:hypothetical protein
MVAMDSSYDVPMIDAWNQASLLLCGVSEQEGGAALRQRERERERERSTAAEGEVWRVEMPTISTDTGTGTEESQPSSSCRAPAMPIC